MVANNLSRLECREPKESLQINNIFPNEQMFSVEDSLWYVDIVSYLAKYITPPDYSIHQRKKFFAELKYYFWKDLILHKSGQLDYLAMCS